MKFSIAVSDNTIKSFEYDNVISVQSPINDTTASLIYYRSEDGGTKYVHSTEHAESVIDRFNRNASEGQLLIRSELNEAVKYHASKTQS